MTVEQRPLGRSGRTISAIGLGCVTFGREIDEKASHEIMDHAVEHGITFFDTAEAYGGGQARLGRKQTLGIDDVREVSGEMSSSELIIGRWMQERGCRDQITLCTKVGGGGSPENIKRALEASLTRLQTDHVEIYKMHSPDARTPIAETLAALNDEVGAGRVGVMGCSNYSAVQLREALDTSRARGQRRFEITQPPYNLVVRDAESELFPLCQSEEIAVTPYSPLGAGFLTGKYTPDRSRFPAGGRFHISPGHADIYFTDGNFRVVDTLRREAAKQGVSTARLAMGWAMTSPSVTSVIVGARTTDHIDNALAAYGSGLSPDLRAEMSEWAS